PNAKEKAKTGYEIGNFREPDPRRFWPIQRCNCSIGSGKTLFINDNWKDTQQAGIQATGLAPPNDLESANRIALQPGNYTAVLSGKNNTTGVGLVEVYDMRRAFSSSPNKCFNSRFCWH